MLLLSAVLQVVNVPALLEKGLIAGAQAAQCTALLAELTASRAAVDTAKDGSSRNLRSPAGGTGGGASALEEVQLRLRTATVELNADPAVKRAVLLDIEQVRIFSNRCFLHQPNTNMHTLAAFSPYR
jgi:hypothetical protein